MTATITRQPRKPADTAKWAEMLAKADREGVEVRQTGSGVWIATSGSDDRAAYVVSPWGCECPGHTYGGYCKHRAKLGKVLGFLVFEDPEPPTPAAPARRNPFGMSDAEMVAAKADTMRAHVMYGYPLVDAYTGELIADAA